MIFCDYIFMKARTINEINDLMFWCPEYGFYRKQSGRDDVSCADLKNFPGAAESVVYPLFPPLL